MTLRIRQLYFYLVGYVSFCMLLLGLAALLRVLLEQWLGVESSGVVFGLLAGQSYFREQTAIGIALTAIGLPVWLLHWQTAQSWLRGPGDESRRPAAERASGLRRLYLYAVLLTTALTVYSTARDVLATLIGLPLGLTSGSESLAGIARPLPYLLVAGLFWAYHWRIVTKDRTTVGEVGASATLRRWYVYGMATFGLVPLMVNLAGLLQQVWGIVFDRGSLAAVGPASTAATVMQYDATALAALAVWLLHRGWSEQAAALVRWHGENERHSVLRKVYLYAVVTGTVTWVLYNASQVVRFALSSLLGVAPETIGGEPVLVALGRPAASILVFGLFWAFHWGAVQAEARAEAELGRQAGVRRLYFYLVAAVSLVIVATSTAALLRLAVDLAILGSSGESGGPRKDLASYLSLLLIGLPVWLYHWTSIQKLVVGPGSFDETRATTRRLYLYLAALAAVAVLLIGGAWIVYDLTVALLGHPLDSRVQAEMGHHLANGVVAGVVLWYHWWLVLRADLAAQAQARSGRTAAAVIAGLDAGSVAALERFVRESLSSARIQVVWSDGPADATSGTAVADATAAPIGPGADSGSRG